MKPLPYRLERLAIIETAARAHWRHDLTGVQPPRPANDQPFMLAGNNSSHGGGN